MKNRKFIISLSVVASLLIGGGTISFACMKNSTPSEVNKPTAQVQQLNIEATPKTSPEVAKVEAAQVDATPTEVKQEVEKQAVVAPVNTNKEATVKEESKDAVKASECGNNCSNGCNQGCENSCVNGCNQGCTNPGLNGCTQGCQNTCQNASTKAANTCNTTNACPNVKVIQRQNTANVNGTCGSNCPTQNTTNTCPNTQINK